MASFSASFRAVDESTLDADGALDLWECFFALRGTLAKTSVTKECASAVFGSPEALSEEKRAWGVLAEDADAMT